MHAEKLHALPQGENHRRQRARQARLWRPAPLHVAGQALARYAEQYRAAQAVEERQPLQDLQVLRAALAEGDAGIDDQARALDARCLAGLDPRLQNVEDVERRFAPELDVMTDVDRRRSVALLTLSLRFTSLEYLLAVTAGNRDEVALILEAQLLRYVQPFSSTA